MSLGMWAFLILLAAKAFGFGHFGWGLVFLPLIIEVVFDAFVLLLFGGAIRAWWGRRKAHTLRATDSPFDY